MHHSEGSPNICRRDEYIDGQYGVLGSAGPAYYRTGTGTAISDDGKATYIGDQQTTVFFYEEGNIFSIDSPPLTSRDIKLRALSRVSGYYY